MPKKTKVLIAKWVIVFSLLLPWTVFAGVMRDAGKTAWFASQASTKALPSAYVVVEPNCWYCMRYYHEIEPLIHAKKMRVRWIVVSFLQPTSLGKAAAILKNKHHSLALHSNELHYHEGVGSGGIKPLKVISKSLRRKIARNNRFMDTHEIFSTPATIYRDQSGKVHKLVGLHSSAELSAMLNHMSHSFR